MNVHEYFDLPSSSSSLPFSEIYNDAEFRSVLRELGQTDEPFSDANQTDELPVTEKFRSDSMFYQNSTDYTSIGKCIELRTDNNQQFNTDLLSEHGNHFGTKATNCEIPRHTDCVDISESEDIGNQQDGYDTFDAKSELNTDTHIDSVAPDWDLINEFLISEEVKPQVKLEVIEESQKIEPMCSAITTQSVNDTKKSQRTTRISVLPEKVKRRGRPRRDEHSKTKTVLSNRQRIFAMLNLPGKPGPKQEKLMTHKELNQKKIGKSKTEKKNLSDAFERGKKSGAQRTMVEIAIDIREAAEEDMHQLKHPLLSSIVKRVQTHFIEMNNTNVLSGLE